MSRNDDVHADFTIRDMVARWSPSIEMWILFRGKTYLTTGKTRKDIIAASRAY